MYILITALIMLTASMLLTWWTRSEARDEPLDLAFVAARARRVKRNHSDGDAGARLRDG